MTQGRCWQKFVECLAIPGMRWWGHNVFLLSSTLSSFSALDMRTATCLRRHQPSPMHARYNRPQLYAPMRMSSVPTAFQSFNMHSHPLTSHKCNLRWINRTRATVKTSLGRFLRNFGRFGPIQLKWTVLILVKVKFRSWAWSHVNASRVNTSQTSHHVNTYSGRNGTVYSHRETLVW